MIQEPPPPFDDRRTPMTPQLARRVAILGTFALTMFAIIFFRLWFIQILSGQKYVAQAKVNRVRDIAIPAPRGEIMDRSGNLLVNSKRAIAVQITPAQLPVPLQATTNTEEAHLIAHPPRADVALYNRLARVLGIPKRGRPCPINAGPDLAAALTALGYDRERLSPIACSVAQGFVQLSYANVTLATDVPRDVLFYLEERQQQFRGVSVQPVWLRTYPLNDVAAQLFGTVGPITRSELQDPKFKGLSQSAIVGQSGLEWYYNRYLQGHDGKEQVQVNALGQAAGVAGRPIQPISGSNLVLSLDVNLQRAGEQALQTAMATIPNAFGGAFVALNPDNGEVYAMGSNPSLTPTSLPTRSPSASTTPGSVPPATTPCSTERSRRLGRPGRRSSRSRRRPPSRAGPGPRAMCSTTPGSTASRVSAVTTPAWPRTGCWTSSRRSRSPPMTSSTTWVC